MILGDFHTHTRYSDGKGRIEDNVVAAVERGLKQVGLSDHGLKHIAFGLRQQDIFRMRDAVDKLQGKYDIDILLGVEANIYDLNGNIDLKEKDRFHFDFVAAGYHKAALPKNLKDFFNFKIPALLKKNFSEHEKQNYTEMFVKVIKSGRVNFVTHLNYVLPVDIKTVATACADYNVYLELNDKHMHLSDDDILTAQDVGASFIINSDAHSPARVGELSRAIATVERLNINRARIVNWDKLVRFDAQF